MATDTSLAVDLHRDRNLARSCVSKARDGDTMSITQKYRAHVDRKLAAMEDGSAPVRVPLTASQHILHLLLSIFTCGLWIPVWVVRGVQGNKTYR